MSPRRVVAAAGAAAVVLAGAGCGSHGRAPDLPIPAGPPGRTATGPGPARATAPAHHVLKMLWGPNTLPDGASAFPVYRRLGVQVLEIQVPWRDAAPRRPAHPEDPNDPAYTWPANVDTAAREAQATGIRLAIMVKDTPAWANGGRGGGWAPTRPADYDAFLAATAKRYPAVRDWMIWGETTRAGNFEPMPPGSPAGPRRYARLLDSAYATLKALDPRNVVIGGMTWTVGEVSPPDFVRWLRLPDGRPPRMDLWGHNPYSTRAPDLSRPPYDARVRDFSDLDTLHDEIAAAYRPTGHVPDLWLSEFSVASDRTNRGFDFFVSRARQARWLRDAYRQASRAPYIAALGWYDLLDDPASVPRGLTNGLMTRTGAPKPAFAAYAAAP